MTPPPLAWSVLMAGVYVVQFVRFGRLTMFAHNPFAAPAMNFWAAVAHLPLLAVVLEPSALETLAPAIAWCRQYILVLLAAAAMLGQVLIARARQSHIDAMAAALQTSTDLPRRMAMARSLAWYGRSPEAIEAYQKTIGMSADTGEAAACKVDACVALAALVGAQGEFDRSEELCRQALALDPSQGLAHFYLGLALRERGDEAEARRAFTRSRELGLPERFRAMVDAMAPRRRGE